MRFGGVLLLLLTSIIMLVVFLIYKGVEVGDVISTSMHDDLWILHASGL